jgi:AcrR family transcriptional regulator
MPEVSTSPAPTRRPRADAERNRLNLLETAKPILAEKGAKASLDEIARAAGVGIGTLYRHFPTRDHLIIAVYEAEIDRLVAAASALGEAHGPTEALRQWIYLFIAFVATKYGMSDAIGSLVNGHGELYSASTERVRETIAGLVDKAEASGELRAGLDPLDLLRAVAGLRGDGDDSEWQAAARRVTDILLLGMRL